MKKKPEYVTREEAAELAYRYSNTVFYMSVIVSITCAGVMVLLFFGSPQMMSPTAGLERYCAQNETTDYTSCTSCFYGQHIGFYNCTGCSTKIVQATNRCLDWKWRDKT